MTIPFQDLLKRVQGEVAAEAKAKAAETTAKKAKTETERHAAQLDADRIRAELDWVPRAIVLVIEEWECACGEDGQDPQGLYILKEHVRMANSSILIPPRSESRLPDDLPRRIKYTNRIVAICPSCMAKSGFTRILVDRVAIEGKTTIPAQNGPYVREWLDKRAPTPEAPDDNR